VRRDYIESRPVPEPILIRGLDPSPAATFSKKLFPWATVNPAGDVYVGWYDDRNDPSNAQLQYFVTKATSGGAGFAVDRPISGLFNPCAGLPDCAYFGDYEYQGWSKHADLLGSDHTVRIGE
jgi:hypothetical protein